MSTVNSFRRYAFVLGLVCSIAAPCAFGRSPDRDGDASDGRRAENLLKITLNDPADLCAQPGDVIELTLSMADLAQPVTAYQAFLIFDPQVMDFIDGQYTQTPFTLPLTTPIHATAGGEIDVSAGIFPTDEPILEDAALATLRFTALDVEGSTQVGFRPHTPPTIFSSPEGQAIDPTLRDSRMVVVTSVADDADGDGTPDPCDLCPCFDDAIDSDGDGFPDGCDGFGDADHDGDVDIDDFAVFGGCLSGPAVIPADTECAVFDAQPDQDVDLEDFAVFQQEFGRSTCAAG